MNPFQVLSVTLLAGAMLASALTPASAAWNQDEKIVAEGDEWALPPEEILVEETNDRQEVVQDTPFSDLQGKQGTEVFKAVWYQYQAGRVKGIQPDYFGVDEPVKRVDAAVMLSNASRHYTNGLVLEITKAPFTDLPSRAIDSVSHLYSMGAVNGKTATTFDSQANITRGEAAVMIYKAYKPGLPERSVTDEASSFSDVTGRYAEAVNALTEMGVIKGRSDGKFGTHQNITRSELLVILYRVKLYIGENSEESYLPDSSTIDYPSSDNGVTITLDKEVYSPSEPIKVTFTNTSEITHWSGFNKFKLYAKVKDGVWRSIPVNPELLPHTGIFPLNPVNGVFETYEDAIGFYESGKFPVGEYRLVHDFGIAGSTENPYFSIAAEFKVVE